jgi:hypothetical protein
MSAKQPRLILKNLQKQWPMFLILTALSVSFLYGWFHDPSILSARSKWADQVLYTDTANRLAEGMLPTPDQLHFTVGYPLLGVVGGFIVKSDPFLFISWGLLLGSAIFSFLAVRRLFGTTWAALFSILLFYWDGEARTFHAASELFAIPWNNQVLFFTMAFFFWLFVTKLKRRPSIKLVTVVGAVAGLSFLTREESVLFVIPMVAAFLFLAKATWRIWLLGFAVIGLSFLPQLIIKQQVAGSPLASTHDDSYKETLTDKYFRLDKLYSNTREVIVDSDHYSSTATNRDALLQAAPWLWLAPIGFLLLFLGKYPLGAKIFVVVSLGLVLFYLAGSNMSAQKLSFHCLRYISPGFLALNFGVIIVLRSIWMSLYNNPQDMRNKIKKTLQPAARWYGHYIAGTVELLPVVLPALLASFGVVVTTLLLLGRLDNVLVLIFGLPAVGVTSWLIARHYRKISRPGTKREQMICDGLVIVAVAVWALINMMYTSQNVYVNRDPAIYSVTGAWLVDNNDLHIPIPDAFGEIEELQATGAGFSLSRLNPNEVYAQGLHLLPIFIGLVGRAFGEGVMLHINPLLGATGLLSVYGFGRLLVRPKWALLAVGVIGISLPLLVFSRDTYTEPLAMTFTFGALALLWGAQARRSLPLWFIAGLTIGAGSLTRIDAYITIIAFAAFAALYLALGKGGERTGRLKHVLTGAAGTLLVTFIGWLDLSRLASGYYTDLSPQFNQQVLMLLVVIGLGVVGVVVSWRTGVLSFLDKHTKSWRGQALAIAVLLLAVFLVSRPFWYVSHHDLDIPLVRGLQAAAGNPQDGTRDYGEQTTNWVAWYIGPVMAVAGVAGVALLSPRAARQKDLLLVPGLLVVVGTCLVFLTRPSIVPDQVWASRRLLPVILPGLAILGVVALERFFAWKRLNHPYRIFAVLLLVPLILVPPILISYPFWKVRTYVPQLAQVNTFCEALPERAAVIWVGDMSQRAVQTTRAFCDVPAKGAAKLDQETLQQIAENTEARGYTVVIALEAKDTRSLPPNSAAGLISAVQYNTMPNTLYAPPKDPVIAGRTVLMGVIDKDGNVVELMY